MGAWARSIWTTGVAAPAAASSSSSRLVSRAWPSRPESSASLSPGIGGSYAQ